MSAASASVPLPKSENENWEYCLWTNRCGSRRRLRWENSLLLPGLWARDVLNAFFAFCLFVTVGQKRGTTKPNPKPTQSLANRANGAVPVTSHSTCCASALLTVWLMRNGGTCHCWKSSVPTRTGTWVPKKGLFQLSQKVPFPLGRMGWPGRQVWSSQGLLHRRSCCRCCFSRNLLEMFLCYGKSELIIFLSYWHLSRKALFCVSTLSGVGVLQLLLQEKWEERRFLLVSNPVLWDFSVSFP